MIYTLLFVYLGIGCINYSLFVARGNALLFMKPKRRDGDARAAGIAEAVFFVVAWPVQLAFFLLVIIHAATSTFLERIMR